MHIIITDVKITVMAYACSKHGLVYIASAWGGISIDPKKYLILFEDNFGNLNCKEFNRPWIAHFLYG